MPSVAVDLLFALLIAGLGALIGWWVSAHFRSRTVVANSEGQRAHEVLNCLQSLAANVATEIGAHNSRVEEINEELVSTGAEAKKIVAVVAKLVDANKMMQGRLDKAEDRLREQARLVESHAAEARTDALTLVGNRRAFDDDIARIFAEYVNSGHGFALAMIDLDHFKRFNDTYGHQAGDEVLRGIGRVLRRTVRDTDIVARYGGEEFAIIFPNVSTLDARKAVSRARQAIAKAHFEFNGQMLQITASMGATQVLDDKNVADVVKRADEALYASKNAGRNCEHWHTGKKILSLVEPKPETKEAAAKPSGSQESKSDTFTPNQPGTLYSEASQTEASGLLSRMAFCQQVRSRLAEMNCGGQVMSLILLEVDDADPANHIQGSDLREQRVMALANLAISVLRTKDMGARYSPNCLAFILPGERLPTAIRVAERIREAVLQHHAPIGDDRLKFTASLGVIEVAQTDDMLAVFRRAETAIDAGRQRGGDCIHYHDGDRVSLITPLAAMTRNAV